VATVSLLAHMRVETRVRAAAALDAEIGCREELRVEAIALGMAVGLTLTIYKKKKKDSAKSVSLLLLTIYKKKDSAKT